MPSRAHLTSKVSRDLGGRSRKELGQGDRESNSTIDKRIERKKRDHGEIAATVEQQTDGQANQLAGFGFIYVERASSFGVTFTRRNEIISGLRDVGEGEMYHGPRVATARQWCLP